VFRDCSRRRSSESDLTNARATASRVRSGPRFSSIDLSSSLFGIRPGACVRCSVPCALETSIFIDQSPSSMINSVSRLLSSSLLGIRPDYCARYSVPCERASATSKLLVRANAMWCALRVLICDAF